VLVDAGAGAKVPLSLLADVRDGLGPNIIQRENVRRRIVVSANVSGRDLGSTVADMQQATASVTLPAGYVVAFEGQFQSQQEASRRIAVLSLFTLASMFLSLLPHVATSRRSRSIAAFIGGLSSPGLGGRSRSRRWWADHAGVARATRS
jgi:HME family heavy-metal exporter